MRLLRYFILLSLSALVLVNDLPAAQDATFAEIRRDYKQLIKSSQLQRQRKNWEALIKRFERFEREHPRNPNLEKALFLRARTWDGLSKASGSRGDAKNAVTVYLQLAERYPTSNLADDALYSAGQAAEALLNDQVAAYNYYQQLIRQLPSGDMAAAAKRRLAALPPPPAPMVTSPPAAPVVSAQGSSLEKIRYWSGPEYTRVVLDLSAPVLATPRELKGDKPRIYFDLLATRLSAQLQSEVPILNGLVRRVRASRFDEKRVRVVLDLYASSDYKLVTLENPYRIVVDIKGKPTQTAAAKPSEIRSAASGGDDSIASILDSATDHVPILHVPQQADQGGIRLIVVDAGHGGKDPGAVGPGRVQEKQVTLGLAKVLAERLRKELGVKVLMTRSGDKYLGLRERTAYANQVGADLFISLHANASPSRSAYGIETYFLNLSKNNQAAEVAARENGTSLQDVSNLEAILFDLMANAKINESSRLAAKIQQAMVTGLKPHYSRIKDLGVRQGPFHVLLGATMPSVLVEAAFISNKREEKRLTSRKYQERVAAAIVEGVKDYAATMDQVAQQ